MKPATGATLALTCTVPCAVSSLPAASRTRRAIGLLPADGNDREAVALAPSS